MAVADLQGKILETIRVHTGYYPIQTQEIAKKLEITIQTAHKGLKILRNKNLIKTRNFNWSRGAKHFHILASNDWPPFLFNTCGNCHNKSTIKTCIFHHELYNQNQTCDLTRIGVKVAHSTVACPWFIPRVGRRMKMVLQDFLNKATQIKKEDTVNESVYSSLIDLEEFSSESTLDQILPKYYCLFCHYPLNLLGYGFIPQLGSSVIRCQNCESLYKLLYDEKENKWFVYFAEERGDVYRQHFHDLAGEPSLVDSYSSTQYGIVIPGEGHFILDKVAEVIIIDNWIGKLSEMDYIVTRSKKDYYDLMISLEKDYSHITIINGEEELISPPPTLQEIGILLLLRKSQLLNKSFCHATISSRKTVLNAIEGLVSEKLRKKGIRIINKQLTKLQKLSTLPPKAWNNLDMHAANAMWQPIAELVKEEGFDFPGRGLGRWVKDVFKPYAFSYGYSEIDAIINALFKKIRIIIQRYCSKINLCWDGLPGFCHKQTHGGTFDFILDLLEPFKLATLPFLCNCIHIGELQPEDVSYIYGRRRQPIYYIPIEGVLDKQLTELCDKILNSSAFGNSLLRDIENYFTRIKFSLQDLINKSNNYFITHHDQKFTLWSVLYYQIWQFLSEEQKSNLYTFLKKVLFEINLEPYTLGGGDI